MHRTPGEGGGANAPTKYVYAKLNLARYLQWNLADAKSNGQSERIDSQADWKMKKNLRKNMIESWCP